MKEEVLLERLACLFAIVQNAQQELTCSFRTNNPEINKSRQESEHISASECILIIDKHLLQGVKNGINHVSGHLWILLSYQSDQRA